MFRTRSFAAIAALRLSRGLGTETSTSGDDREEAGESGEVSMVSVTSNG